MQADRYSLSIVYEERNALALAFAQLARAQGWPVNVGPDANDPDPAWVVVNIHSPIGQLSYTMPASQITAVFPEPGPEEYREAVPYREGLRRLRAIAQGLPANE